MFKISEYTSLNNQRERERDEQTGRKAKRNERQDKQIDDKK